MKTLKKSLPKTKKNESIEEKKSVNAVQERRKSKPFQERRNEFTQRKDFYQQFITPLPQGGK